MKTAKTTKVTLRQLYNFCAKNSNKTFIMNTPDKCLFAQYAQKVLKMGTNIRCCFSYPYGDTAIKINGKRIDFPASIVHEVHEIANYGVRQNLSGNELAKTIRQIAKKKF